MTDREARELLRLTHLERKLRGYLRAFAEELEGLACHLSHRDGDRVAADMRDLASQMAGVGDGSAAFVSGWITQRAEDDARRQEVQTLKRRGMW